MKDIYQDPLRLKSELNVKAQQNRYKAKVV